MIGRARYENVKTGEVFAHEGEYPDVDAFCYMWDEGNYACDCNKDIFAGVSDAGDTGYCIGDGKYSLLGLEVREDDTWLSVDVPSRTVQRMVKVAPERKPDGCAGDHGWEEKESPFETATTHYVCRGCGSQRWVYR
jgi:hypothetical protein